MCGGEGVSAGGSSVAMDLRKHSFDDGGDCCNFSASNIAANSSEKGDLLGEFPRRWS